MAISASNFINLGSQEVEIPCFPGNDEKIKFRLKKVSAMGLMINGRIPNELMSTVLSVFEGKSEEDLNKLKENPDKVLKEDGIKDLDFSKMAQFIDVVCNDSMIEPRYEEVKDYMTDEQKQFVFGWAYEGERGQELSTFPEEQADL